MEWWYGVVVQKGKRENMANRIYDHHRQDQNFYVSCIMQQKYIRRTSGGSGMVVVENGSIFLGVAIYVRVVEWHGWMKSCVWYGWLALTGFSGAL